MAPQSAHTPLVYDRVGQNRRQTRLLIVLAVALTIPCLLLAGYLLARLVVILVAFAPSLLIDGRFLTRVWIAPLLNGFDQHPLPLVLVTTGGVTAFLGLLFWAIATSPGSRLLARAEARPATTEEVGVERMVENLALGAGVRAPKVYILESSSPNAFTVGTNPEHAAIAVTKGALRLLDHRELEGLLAHELSHIGNHDILLSTVIGTMVLFLRTPAMVVVTLGLSQLLALALQSSLSREREFLADADAVLLTRYPEGLMCALAKIGTAGSSIAGTNAAYSHFYFADPESSRWGMLGHRLLTTHPTVQQRIQRLADFQGVEAVVGLEAAIHEGRQYKESHPLGDMRPELPETEFSVLNQGNPAGRVFRVLSRGNVPIYDQPDTRSEVLGYLHPGRLVVAFDDPGPYREVNTADQTFGYISNSVPLQSMPDLTPAEVYDPRTLAGVEAALPPFLPGKE